MRSAEELLPEINQKLRANGNVIVETWGMEAYLRESKVMKNGSSINADLIRFFSENGFAIEVETGWTQDAEIPNLSGTFDMRDFYAERLLIKARKFSDVVSRSAMNVALGNTLRNIVRSSPVHE